MLPLNRFIPSIQMPSVNIPSAQSHLKKIVVGTLGFVVASAEAKDIVPLNAASMNTSSYLPYITTFAAGLLGILALRQCLAKPQLPSPKPESLYPKDPHFGEIGYEIRADGLVGVQTKLDSYPIEALWSFLAFANSKETLKEFISLQQKLINREVSSLRAPTKLSENCTLKDLLFSELVMWRRLTSESHKDLQAMMDVVCYDKKMLDAFFATASKLSEIPGTPVFKHLAEMSKPSNKNEWVELMIDNPTLLANVVTTLLRKVTKVTDEPKRFSQLKDFLKRSGVNYDTFKVSSKEVDVKNVDLKKFYSLPNVVDFQANRLQALELYSEEDLMTLVALASKNESVMDLFQKRGSRVYARDFSSFELLDHATFKNSNFIQAFIQASRAPKEDESRTTFCSRHKAEWIKLFTDTNGHFLAEVLTILLQKVGGLKLDREWKFEQLPDQALTTQRYERFLARFGIDWRQADKKSSEDSKERAVVSLTPESKRATLPLVDVDSKTSSALVTVAT